MILMMLRNLSRSNDREVTLYAKTFISYLPADSLDPGTSKYQV